MRRRSSRGPEEFVGLLASVLRGRVEARIAGVPAAVLDGDARELSVDLRAIGGPRGIGSVLHESHLGLWSARGVPGALAKAGWSVRLREGEAEVVRMGRGATALTGHLDVHPLAAWRARRAEGPTSGSP